MSRNLENDLDGIIKDKLEVALITAGGYQTAFGKLSRRNSGYIVSATVKGNAGTTRKEKVLIESGAIVGCIIRE